MHDDVLGFQVTVDNPCSVKEFNSVADLLGEADHLFLRDLSVEFHVLVESAVEAGFEQQVHVFFVIEYTV